MAVRQAIISVVIERTRCTLREALQQSMNISDEDVQKTDVVIDGVRKPLLNRTDAQGQPETQGIGHLPLENYLRSMQVLIDHRNAGIITFSG